MKRLLVIRLHCKRITKNINCRNREISDDMRRRLNIITAILMILAILFASCSPSAADGDSTGTAGEDRTRTEISRQHLKIRRRAGIIVQLRQSMRHQMKGMRTPYLKQRI